MDTQTMALKLIRKNYYVSSLYFKDAYYSISMYKDDRKLLGFKWKDQTYKFNALQNGIAMAPRLFIRLLFATFQKKATFPHLILTTLRCWKTQNGEHN